MSLVYNNDKPIGKCESYSIDKIPGTTPFVMLTNYEPLRSELNENQQVVLDWLKNNAEWGTPTGLIYELTKRNSMAAEYIITAHDQLNKLEQFQVLAAYADWGMKEVAE